MVATSTAAHATLLDSLVVDKELASRSLFEFTKQAWPLVERKRPFDENWHHEVLCDALERVARGECKRLIINIPPRTTKSIIVSVMFPAWVWIRDQAAQFLTGSHSQTLAVRDAVNTRRLVEGPWYQSRWPDVVMTSDQNAKTQYDLAGGGRRLTFGMKSGVTGEGGDFLVIDDPHPAKEGMWSEKERAAAKQTFDSELFTRLNDPKTSAIIVVMQRLHEDDLTGHLLKEEGWEHVCLPMEFDDKIASKHDRRRHDTSLPRLLHEERFDRDFIEKATVRLGPFGASGQLQQSPIPTGGGIVKETWWRYWLDWPDPAAFAMCFQSWDLTFDETESGSYVVGQLWGVPKRRVEKDEDGEPVTRCLHPDRYLLMQIRERLDVVGQMDAIYKLTEQAEARGYKTRAIVIENKANGAAVIRMLKRKVTGVIAWPEKGGGRMGSKEARLGAASPMVNAGNYILPHPDKFPWVRGFTAECAAVPRGEHDDQADGFSQAHDYMERRSGSLISSK